MTDKYRQGSFTIETALVMPTVLTVIILLVYLMIYMYDLTVCQAALYQGTQSYVYEANKSNKDIEKIVYSNIQSRLSERLLGISDAKVEIKIWAGNIDANVSAKTDMPLPFGEEFNEPFREIVCSRKVSMLKGSDVIGRTREIIRVYELAQSMQQKEGESVDDTGY